MDFCDESAANDALAAIKAIQGRSAEQQVVSTGRAEAIVGITVAPAANVPGSGGYGVVITHVDAESRAADRGLRNGDVILEVAGMLVSTPLDVDSALENALKAGKHAALLRVKSGGSTRFMALPIGP